MDSWMFLSRVLGEEKRSERSEGVYVFFHLLILFTTSYMSYDGEEGLDYRYFVDHLQLVSCLLGYRAMV